MLTTFQKQLQHIIDLKSYNPFRDVLPEDKEAIIDCHNSVFPTTVRINPHKDISAFNTCTSIPWNQYGYYLSERPVFTLDPLLHAGAYYVQEASSMFVGVAFEQILQNITDRDKGIKVLDLCAAPGGKSTLLASYLNDNDILISNEVIQSRATILIENMVKWGQANTWVIHNDPKDIGRVKDTFDVMLIDAPCTGSGLWRRDHNTINEWSEEHVKLCAERQKRIIADSYPSLQQGGYIIYSTCSYSPEEDEEIADWIMDNYDVKPVSIALPNEWGIVTQRSDKHNIKGYHFYPWRIKGEGLYLTVFQKQDGAITKEYGTKQRQNNNKKNRPKDSFTPHEKWHSLLKGEWSFINVQNDIYAFLPEHLAFFDWLKTQLYIKKAGIKLGQQTHKDIIPDHELALSVHLKENAPKLNVDLETALRFLKKENINVEQELKGWHIVTYKGLGLGWGKWMPGRMNNYLPKHWRIRMDITQ
jgi:16S rRNA C967 or C1407 C5-methylase (RsmB/RsmF family)/NOL1/NOP2/fmu family ribosome biogenesis protein